ncbi:hypothetical protein GWD52_02260 [Enterobacteriaceae bacterium 4M9]|nr:hypothetical protein [Enterobacteriaceae bacterium 4M9]
MEQEFKDIVLLDETFYKLYKADIGAVVNGQHCEITENGDSDPINGRYRKIDGGFATDDNRTSLTTDGLLRRTQAYLLTFKDLSDGHLYYMRVRLKSAPTPEDEISTSTYSSYYYEPSSDASSFNHVASSGRCNTRTIHIYTRDSSPN